METNRQEDKQKECPICGGTGKRTGFVDYICAKCNGDDPTCNECRGNGKITQLETFPCYNCSGLGLIK